MTTLIFREAYQRLTRQSVELTVDPKFIDIERLLDILISEFQAISIDTTYKAFADNDILIFTYGEQETENHSVDFLISVRRQIKLNGRNNSKAYGFDIYFDVNKVSAINDSTVVCKNKDLTDIWKKDIKASKGFEKTLNLEFKQIRFKFE